VGFDGEDTGEEVLLVLRKHFITNLRWIVISIAMFLAPTLLAILFSFSGALVPASITSNHLMVMTTLWYLISFGYTFAAFLIWHYSVNLVTSKRIVDIDFLDFVYRRYSEAFLNNIQDLTHEHNGAIQILFNYGYIFIHTAAEVRVLEFDLVPQPAAVQDFISDLAAKYKRRRRNGV